MLTSIFQWLTAAVGGMMDVLVNVFIDALDMSMGAYLDTFPLLATAYDLMRVVGLGMTLLIAAVGLFQFLALRSFEMRYVERPEQIIFKAAIAAGLTYFGGYVLEQVVRVAALSFNMFRHLDATTFDGISQKFTVDALRGSLEFAGVGLLDSTLDLVLVTVEMVLVILIAYNVFRLVLEVAERFMMVGVLVFTSPLVYCTLASSQTAQIFKRWVSMIVSSCILMSLSALFLKLVVNGLYAIEPGGKYFLQLLLILAMCKIAQRVDTYMNQLGLTAAITGGGMLEDLAAVGGLARSIGMVTGLGSGGKASRNSVLGSNGVGSAKPSPIAGTGPIAAGVNGFKNAKSAFINGATPKAAAQAGAAAAKSTLKDNPVFASVAAQRAVAKNGGSAEAQMNAANEAGRTAFRAQAAQTVMPNTMNARRAMADAQGEAQVTANHNAYEQASQMKASPVGGPVTEEAKEKIAHGKTFSNSEADTNFGVSGVAKEGESVFGAERDYAREAADTLAQSNKEFAADLQAYRSGEMQSPEFNSKWGEELASSTKELREAALDSGDALDLGENATAAGCSLQYNDGNPYISGRDPQIGAVLANEYGRDGISDPSQGVKDLNGYENAAIESIATDPTHPDNAAFEKFLDGYTEKEPFKAQYRDAIDARAAELRDLDIQHNDEVNKDYRNIVANTATYGSPNASLGAFFDNNSTLEDNDRLGNAMMERAFSGIAADRANGSKFTDVRAHDRPNTVEPATGDTLYGGRVVEANYQKADGTMQNVRIYDQTAYVSLSSAQRDDLFSFKGSDGRLLYSNVQVGDEPRIISNGGRRTSVRQSDTVIRDPGSRSSTPPPKRSNKNKFKR